MFGASKDGVCLPQPSQMSTGPRNKNFRSHRTHPPIAAS